MSAAKPVIVVAFYSTYGHIKTLADSVIKGVEATGATVKPYIFSETLSDEVRAKMHAAPQASYPEITPDDLKGIDGLIIGAPTRYGRVPAQVSSFFDKTGGLWMSGALTGMPVTQFSSVSGQHGGHESNVLTTMPYYIHMGMVYVPIGYQRPETRAVDHVHGLGPYGASTVAAADGSRQPLNDELDVAEFQGKYFAEFVTALKKGRQA